VSEQNKSVARRFFLELHGANYLAAADEILDPNILVHGPGVPPGGIRPGSEGFKEMMGRFQTAFPDRRLTIEEMIAEGDKVMGRWTFSGTHTGPLGDIPPSGKHVMWAGVSIIRIAAGRVVEDWAISDAFRVMQELGITPLPGRAEGAVSSRPKGREAPH